jgi:peptidoglycan/LPS O-acetylase OafA/YrhL
MMWVAGILLLVVFGIKGGLYAFSNFSISLGMPWVELLAFGLVYTALQNRGNRLEKALNWDWIQWLGRYSYSIYLLHVPCLFLAIHLFKNSQGSISGLIFSTAFYLVASLLLARLAWVLVEQPFLNMRHKFKPRFSPAK